MEQLSSTLGVVRFGPFEADLRTGELRKHGLRLKVPLQSVQILALLLAHPGDLVTREELRLKLWSDDVFVDFEHGLNKAVNKLRDVLGDDPDAPLYIETLPRRGYRFIAPVEGLPAVAGKQACIGAPDSQVSAEAHTDEARPGRGNRRYIFGFGLLAATIGLVLAAVVIYRLQHQPPGTTTRFQFSLPQALGFGYPDWPVISPDGNLVAFAGVGQPPETGLNARNIWLRSLDTLRVGMLNGTTRAIFPFWSPDSRSIAFFADRKLQRIAVAGGPPEVLCDLAALPRGGTWSTQGVILFGHAAGRGIYRVPAGGGEPKPVTKPDQAAGEMGHVFPQFLPDGDHFIYFARNAVPDKGAIYVDSLNNPGRKRLLANGSAAIFSPPGYLLFVRDGALLAQPFDVRRLELSGDAVAVVQQFGASSDAGLMEWWMQGTSYISASQNGTLVYRAAKAGSTQLTWFDRHGGRLGTLGPPAEYSNPYLSVDGSKLAVGRLDPQLQTRDIWAFDVSRGTSSRLTFDPADDLSPLWSPDGSRVFFTSNRRKTNPAYKGPGVRDIYQRPASGAGSDSVVFESKQAKAINDISRDGHNIIYDTSWGAIVELWILPLTGERKPYPVVQGKFVAAEGSFSPSGRFIAYVSNETGRFEVYVQNLTGRKEKWQVSTEGGDEPLWRADGKELFFLTPGPPAPPRHLVSVEVSTEGDSFQAALPQLLFEPPRLIHQEHRVHYAVMPDGQRFLFNAAVESPEDSLVNVVVNWPASLRK